MSESLGAHHPGRPLVVVGVDGSAGSLNALVWALGYADKHGAAVRVVTAWHEPAHRTTSAEWDPETASGEMQRRCLESVGDLAHGVPVEHVVVAGWPGEVLTELSEAADLLVVGATGHSRVQNGRIGSTSLHCISHSHCTIVIVRPPKRI